MKEVIKSIYEEMKQLGLIEPEVEKDNDGKSIYILDKETKRRKKVVNKKCRIASQNKKSKTYFVDEPCYKKYLDIKNNK